MNLTTVGKQKESKIGITTKIIGDRVREDTELSVMSIIPMEDVLMNVAESTALQIENAPSQESE